MEIELYSKLACDGGVKLATVAGIAQCSYGRVIDHSDTFTLRVPQDADWLASLTLRKVFRTTDEAGRVLEWFCKTIDDGRSRDSDGMVTITADPSIIALANLGVISLPSGGRPQYNHGLDNATPRQYIATFAEPWLTDIGVSWIDVGTFSSDDADRLALSFERWTLLQLVRELAKITACEIDWYRNGDTSYVLGVVPQRHSSLPLVEVRTDRNIVAIQRTRNADTLYTAIVPVGQVPSNDAEVSTLGYARWQVTAKSSNTLTLGDDPIGFDDQLNGKYALRPDATLTEITDTVESTQQIIVDDATGIEVDDYIEIRKNSSGDLLEELTNPAAITSLGRCVGTVQDTTMRGEPNMVPNPIASDWSHGSALDGAVDGAHGSGVTTINLKALSTGAAIVNLGTLFIVIGGTGRTRVIATGATVNSSGLASITITSSLSVALSDNDPVRIFNYPLPDDWLAPEIVGNDSALVYGRVDPSQATQITGFINGTHSAATALTLDGLSANELLNPGDVIVVTRAGPDVSYVVQSPVQITAGAAVVKVSSGTAGDIRLPTFNINETDNDAVTIYRASFATHGPNVIWLPQHPGTPTTYHLDSPSYKVRYTADMPTVWAAVGLTIMAPGLSTLTYSGNLKHKLEVYNVDGAAVLDTLTDEDRSIASLASENVTLRQAVTISASTTIRLRTYPSGTGSIVQSFARWYMLWIGFDDLTPFVVDSHANRLWHLANMKLAELSVEPLRIQVTVAELALSNPDLVEDALDVGQEVHLVATDMVGGETIDRTLRIVGIYGEHDNPNATRLILDSIDPRVTESISDPAQTQLYVQINTSDGILTGKTTAQNPFNTTGASRGSVTSGSEGDDDGTSPIDLNPYDPDGFVS